jgi:hypothetical protein
MKSTKRFNKLTLSALLCLIMIALTLTCLTSCIEEGVVNGEQTPDDTEQGENGGEQMPDDPNQDENIDENQDTSGSSEGLEIYEGIIVGIGTCTDSVLYLNLPVDVIAFENCQTITEVHLGPGVTYIG